MPPGQKKPEGHTLQLDCAWFEQLDEYDPAAHAQHVPLMAQHPGQQQETHFSVQGGGGGLAVDVAAVVAGAWHAAAEVELRQVSIT